MSMISLCYAHIGSVDGVLEAIVMMLVFCRNSPKELDGVVPEENARYFAPLAANMALSPYPTSPAS